MPAPPLRHPPPPERALVATPRETRLWAKVDRSAGPAACWPWLACTHRATGKARVFWGTNVCNAIRVTHELLVGPLPPGVQLRRRAAICPRPDCVNPAHHAPSAKADPPARPVPPTDLERFRARYIADPATGCWDWIGGFSRVHDHNYPKFGTGGASRDTPLTWHYAHRWSYRHLVGPIPADRPVVARTCENEICVNPAHLEAITFREALARAPRYPATKADQSGLCLNGHPRTPDNIAIDARGMRRCRTCRDEAQRRHNERQRALRAAKRADSPYPRAREYAALPRAARRDTCPHGHAKTPDNLYIDPHGVRRCRACKSATNSRAYRLARAAIRATLEGA